MPDHKSQHFVPRCYFKAFSLSEEGAAINLFNIRSEKCVQNAPVKGQCARNYLYGENLKLEKSLQWYEGEYAGVISTLLSDPSSMSDGDIYNLRECMFLQGIVRLTGPEQKKP